VRSAACTPFASGGPLAFAESSEGKDYRFIHANAVNPPELVFLRTRYRLDSIAAQGRDERGRILAIMHWTHTRWTHNGSNQPSAPRALTILEEAEKGARFRCVEYGIVLKSALAAIGQPARTLGLKTRDVERTRIGAGHVCAEVWSHEHRKWVLVDAQYDVMPMAGDTPLNAVELQDALVHEKPITLIDVNGPVIGKRRAEYLDFIAKYLYFFDCKFDQREVPYDSLWKYGAKAVLMLVPIGAKPPVRFQRGDTLDYLEPTNALGDIYRAPE
jgi:hypothetical protein